MILYCINLFLGSRHHNTRYQVGQAAGVPHVTQKGRRKAVPQLRTPRCTLLGKNCMPQPLYATRKQIGRRFELSAVGSEEARLEETNVSNTKALDHDSSFHRDCDIYTIKSLKGWNSTSHWGTSTNPRSSQMVLYYIPRKVLGRALHLHPVACKEKTQVTSLLHSPDPTPSPRSVIWHSGNGIPSQPPGPIIRHVRHLDEALKRGLKRTLPRMSFRDT